MSDEKKSWLDKAGAVHLWKTIEAMLGTKVDKIEGFGLSSNDYTTEEKKKLATLADPDVATTENNGLMSSADKAKLDGIEEGANNYTHPTYEEKQAGLYRISVDNTGHVATADKMTSEELAAEGVSPVDHTHDLGELADTLEASADAVEDADTVMVGATVTSDDGSASTKYTRRPLAILWNWIKAKADTLYAVVGHNHKVNELENYDTHVYNPTLNRTKRTVLAAPTAADGPATFRTLDKNDVGLGNVDNVAALPLTGGTMLGPIKFKDNTSLPARSGQDYILGIESFANGGTMKWSEASNVKVGSATKADSATTATYASALSGLTKRTSQTQGNQTGTFVHGEDDSTGGSFAFRRDNPSAGQMSMIIDGCFYQKEGKYKVLDTNDAPGLTVGTASFATQTQFDKATIISAANLDVNKWYPVVSTNTIPYSGLRHIKCNVQLNSGTKPSWSTHSAGFTVNLDMLVTACGWGTTSARSIVLDNSYQFVASGSSSPAGYSQMTNGSVAVFWVRGGGSYHIYSDQDAKWQLQTSTFTSNGQSVAPTTSYPGVSYNKATLDGDGFTIRAQTSDPGAGSGLATGTVLLVYA